MKRFFCLLLSSLLISAIGLSAQVPRQPVVKVATFTGDGLNTAELLTLERLVSSYVVEMRAFKVIDDSGRDLALNELEASLAMGATVTGPTVLTADFILSGNVGRLGDRYIVTIQNTRVSSGEQLSVSETVDSVNDIVLRIRSLTFNLFQRSDMTAAGNSVTATAATAPGSVQSEAFSPSAGQSTTTANSAAAIAASIPQSYRPDPQPADLVGTWRGTDRNIESIQLFADGSGVALINAGPNLRGSLRLRYTISRGVITSVQNQANDPRLYRTASIDHPTAMRIAAQARPLRWEFQLNADGSSLFGTRYGIAINGTTNGVRVDNTYTSPMHWFKISR